MKRFVLLLSLIFCLNVAYAFTIDGIEYSEFAHSSTASVIGYTSDLPDDVVIPSEVTYEGTKYSVTAIGFFAFGGCTSLKSIKIPDSVTEIGFSAFTYCSSLKSIEIPNSVTAIGNEAFEYWTSLTSVKLGSGIKQIGSLAFMRCTALSSVDMSEGVTNIGGSAFMLCSALKSIKLPKSVTKIGDSAFARCDSLKKIKSLNQLPPEVAYDTYYEVDKSNCQLIVPKGSLEKYKEAKYWKEFLNISDDLVVLNQLPEVKYGDVGIDLSEYAPEGVALAYESSDNNIARIDGTKLTICGAGEVNVNASLVEEGTQLELNDPVRKFVVGKAELTATAQSYEIKQGEPIPEFEIIYEGFVYDDNADSLQEPPVASCIAKSTSAPRRYEITLTGGDDSNYNIKTVNGRLTIWPVSGVSDIEDDEKPFCCVVTDGQILIRRLTSSQAVAIYDASGRICYRADATEDGTLTYRPDNAGVYIVRSGSQAVKVIVR